MLRQFLKYLLIVTIFKTLSSEKSEHTIKIYANNTEIIKSVPEKIQIESREIESLRAVRYPCYCDQGNCGCCTGFLLDTLRQKGCLNITYEPDDFEFRLAVSFNNRVVFKNKISGKNPPPMCVHVPRIRQLRFCVKFSNVYFAGRNMHVCLGVDLNWDQFQLFHMNFDCVRVGTDGFAVVPPEEGGGISVNTSDEDDEDEIEDYDEDA